MSIEKLKEQARRHEQKEEWLKALDQYKKAIAKLAEEDQPDIGLYNRVGDLYVRVGNLDQAVEHYEQAVDLYMEADLHNNAIAVCKKVIRNVPDRHASYLKMGQIRAQQNFIPDARTNFLTYAERVAQAGDMEESLRALDEFTELAPEDVEVRLFLAEQLASHDREADAVQHLVHAYQVLDSQGETQQAASVKERVHSLDPSADLTAAPAASGGGGPAEMAFETGAGFAAEDGEIGGDFGDISLGDDDEEEVAEEAVAEAAEEAAGVSMEDFEIGGVDEEEEEDEDEADMDLPMMDFGEDDEEEAEDLPMMDVEMGDGEEEDADEIPMMDVEIGDEEADDTDEIAMMDVEIGDGEEDDADDLPTMDVGLGADEEEDEELPLMELDTDDQDQAAAGDSDSRDQVEEAVEEAASEAATELTVDQVQARLEEEPDDISLHQRMVELAYGTGRESDLVDAYLGLARALERQDEPVRAKAAYQQVLGVDPTHEEARAGVSEGDTPAKPVKEVAANEDYVDLGSMILGDEEEKTTRFTVAYEEPSGDEEADFAKMLSQFKDKVSENLGADDVRSHHDLGTAYKEMGLLDEAIAEFQQALRADSGHLPTYELMGQTFMEMDKADQAIRSMERALNAPYEVEDELLGIYYYLARAYEDEGNTDKALEFYDRVFSLDINFADVTERLRALRPA